MKPRRPLVYGGEVVKGRIVFDLRKLLDAALPAWNGERVTVTIAQEVQVRSTRANAFLWSVVYKVTVEALRDAGHNITAEEWHWLMKQRHNSTVVTNPLTGQDERVGKSTAKLTVDEFTAFIDAAMLDAAELLGVSFPPPRPHEEWREAE